MERAGKTRGKALPWMKGGPERPILSDARPTMPGRPTPEGCSGALCFWNRRRCATKINEVGSQHTSFDEPSAIL